MSNAARAKEHTAIRTNVQFSTQTPTPKKKIDTLLGLRHTFSGRWKRFPTDSVDRRRTLEMTLDSSAWITVVPFRSVRLPHNQPTRRLRRRTQSAPGQRSCHGMNARSPVFSLLKHRETIPPPSKTETPRFHLHPREVQPVLRGKMLDLSHLAN